MNWILDTNVISETRRPKPKKPVLDWLASQPSTALMTSVVCLAEIRSGILMKDDQGESRLLEIWFRDVVVPMFDGKVVAISDQTLLTWLDLLRERQGRQVAAPPVDMLIAATCLSIGCGIATRDVAPFVAVQVPTLNPFTGERFNGA